MDPSQLVVLVNFESILDIYRMVQRIVIGLSALAFMFAIGTWLSNRSQDLRTEFHPSSLREIDVPAGSVSSQSDGTLSPSAVSPSAVRFIAGQGDPKEADKRSSGKLVQIESSPARQDAKASLTLPPSGGSLPPSANPQSGLPNVPATGLRVPADTGALRNPGLNSGSASPSAGTLTYTGVLSFVNDIPIPAQTDGIIQELHVDEGSVVEANSVLIEIDNRLAKAEEEIAERELESAQLKADDDSQIKFSKASHDVATSVFKRSQELYAEGVENLDEWEKKRLEKIKALFQINVSEREQNINKAAVGVNKAKLGASRVQIELRTIRAPFAGVVAEVKKERFEWVKAGEEILRLVSLEKFRVKGSLRVADSPNLLVGAPAKVFIPIGSGKVEVVDGVVGFVKPESEGSRDGINEYRVWVEIPNRIVDGRYLFRGSMDARVEIYPNR